MREIRRYSETNNNKNKTFQNLWDTAKAVLSGKSIALNAYIRKEDIKTIIWVHTLKKSEKEEQTKSKVSKWKEIIKIRTESMK